MALLPFDPNQHQPTQQNFEAIPSGNYQVMISSAEVAQTKAGGQMLKVTLDIVAPSHVGRKVFHQMNLTHPTSVEAQRIGREQICSLFNCAGLQGGNDTDHLLNRIVVARIVKSHDQQYGDQNDVKYYLPVQEQQAPQPAQQQMQQPMQQQQPVQQQQFQQQPQQQGFAPQQQQFQQPAQQAPVQQQAPQQGWGSPTS